MRRSDDIAGDGEKGVRSHAGRRGCGRGGSKGVVAVFGSGTAATGTLTVAGGLASSWGTLTIGGVDIAGSMGFPQDSDARAAAIAVSVNTYVVSVSAVAVGSVVTITSIVSGVAGNSIGLISADANVTPSAATLTGGAD